MLFVHGAYVGAWVWEEYFLPFFAAEGHEAHALSLRGHGASDGGSRLAGIDDYVEDVLEALARIEGPAVLVGHSMGGMVVQRCLGRSATAGAVLMATVPPWGLGVTAAELAWRDPRLALESAWMPLLGPLDGGGGAMLEAMFSPELAPRRRAAYARRAGPESPRAIAEMVTPLGWTLGGCARVPLLVLGGGRDAFFPRHVVHATAWSLGATVRVFPRMGHAMMLEPRWSEPAGLIIDWVRRLDASGA